MTETEKDPTGTSRIVAIVSDKKVKKAEEAFKQPKRDFKQPKRLSVKSLTG